MNKTIIQIFIGCLDCICVCVIIILREILQCYDTDNQLQSYNKFEYMAEKLIKFYLRKYTL